MDERIRMAVAKVIVDLALDKEFDYEIPEELAERVKVGTNGQCAVR